MSNLRNLVVFVAAFGLSLVSSVFAVEPEVATVPAKAEAVVPAVEAVKESVVTEEKKVVEEKKEEKKAVVKPSHHKHHHNKHKAKEVEKKADEAVVAPVVNEVNKEVK